MAVAKGGELHTSTKPFPDDYVNPRGIPRVEFIDVIPDFLKQRGVTVETILRQFQEQHSKYKLMEHKLSQNLSLLQTKIPEIKKNKDAIKLLKSKAAAGETFETNFGVTDMAFVEAKVPPTKTVHLWLGANVMVEYTLDEAEALLQKNLDSALGNLNTTQEDLAWLRDQQTTCEVNMSRVYNYEVERTKKEKEGGKTA